MYFVVYCRVCIGLQRTNRMSNLKRQSMQSHIIYIVLSKARNNWHLDITHGRAWERHVQTEAVESRNA